MDGVNRNLKVSVITPNGAVYDMVQQMTRVSRRIEPSQVILINGARKGAKLQIAEAVRSEVVAFFAWEPMATKLAASYPQVQVYVIQPSVLDLLRCIYFAPKGGKLGAIIPLPSAITIMTWKMRCRSWMSLFIAWRRHMMNGNCGTLSGGPRPKGLRILSGPMLFLP